VEVRHLIRRLAKESTVVLSTHILSEVEAVCDRVIILLNGEVKADARLEELEASTDVILVLEQETAGAEAALRALPGVNRVQEIPTPDGLAYRVQPADGSVIPPPDLRPAVYALARDNGWSLKELRRDVRTLEAVFNELATTVGGNE
jgi:ABC-2 type transport system ATP-binding protein